MLFPGLKVGLSLESFHPEVHTGIRALALGPILGFAFLGFTPQPHSMLSPSDAVFPELALAEGEMHPHGEESGARTPALKASLGPCCFREAKRLGSPQFPRITRQPCPTPLCLKPSDKCGFFLTHEQWWNGWPGCSMVSHLCSRKERQAQGITVAMFPSTSQEYRERASFALGPCIDPSDCSLSPASAESNLSQV